MYLCILEKIAMFTAKMRCHQYATSASARATKKRRKKTFSIVHGMIV